MSGAFQQEKRNLSERDLQHLRQRGLLSAEETAFWLGEVLIVENLVSRTQRHLQDGGTLQLESRKRVLNG